MGKLKSDINSSSGFTLVEIVVSIMLLGIIAVFTIFFIISGVSGYVFSKQSAALSQKASLALARITRELNSEVKEIESISSSSIKYVYQYDPRDSRWLKLVGSGDRKELKLVVGGAEPGDADPEVLIDQVSAFTMVYKKCDDTAWVVADGMQDLCRIDITLTLFVGPSLSKTVSFETSVNPPGHFTVIGFLNPALRPQKEKRLC